MGIRESLEKSAQEKEALKMQDLAFEQQEEKVELLFDPEKELTEEDWKIFEEVLDSKTNDVHLAGLLEYAAYYKIVSPERFEKYKKSKLDSKRFSGEMIMSESSKINCWEFVENFLKNWQDKELGLFITNYDVEKYPTLTYDLTLLGDETFTSSIGRLSFPRGEFIKNAKYIYSDKLKDFNLKSREWRNSLDDVQNLVALENVVNMMILFPQQIEEIRRFVEERKDAEIARIKNSQNEIRYFVCDLANMKIVFPEAMAQFNLDKNFFSKAIRYSKKLKERNPESFVHFLASLKIISAKEVRITDQGLELIMPDEKQFKPERHQRPERREY